MIQAIRDYWNNMPRKRKAIVISSLLAAVGAFLGIDVFGGV